MVPLSLIEFGLSSYPLFFRDYPHVLLPAITAIPTPVPTCCSPPIHPLHESLLVLGSLPIGCISEVSLQSLEGGKESSYPHLCFPGSSSRSLLPSSLRLEPFHPTTFVPGDNGQPLLLRWAGLFKLPGFPEIIPPLLAGRHRGLRCPVYH